MNDLISRSALLENAFEVHTHDYGNIEVVGVDAISEASAVDAVEVVRCGECKGWEKEGRKIHRCDLARMFGFSENCYCCLGKRKEAHHE